jgi:membrane-bound metal-dependent hydrolase YbcI (DUF457 family)
LLDIETIDTLPGGGYGNRVIHADYTHSLLGALVLCAAFGAVAWWRWDRRLGLLLGAVAFSHWILDLIVHRGDMPILPGNAGDLPLLGFGLWRVPIVAIPLEAALLLLGVFLYWRAARSVGSRPAAGSLQRLWRRLCWCRARSFCCRRIRVVNHLICGLSLSNAV